MSSKAFCPFCKNFTHETPKENCLESVWWIFGILTLGYANRYNYSQFLI